MGRIALRAMEFAHDAHDGQVRKYTGEPYFQHLAEVAAIVASADGCREADLHQDVPLAVAWLHDCVEDRGIQYTELDRRFGIAVAQGVIGLSDLETGNRAERKQKSRKRLSLQPGWIQTIKVADMISNTRLIVKHDPKFAVLYLEEKRLLLDVLDKADRGLLAIARKLVSDGQAALTAT